MAIKWERWDSEKISPRELLGFRNKALGLKSEPSPEELHAMKIHLAELARDKSLYNLVAFKSGKITAWMNGKFSEARLTDIIRSLFFDHDLLSKQEVDDLLYQLEVSLPHPFRRIEIHGLGPGRTQTAKLVSESGYRPAFEVAYFQRTIGKRRPSLAEAPTLDFDHTIYIHTAYDIYRNAFSSTWDRDMVVQAELVPIIEASDTRFSFLAFIGESPAGLVVANKGLSGDDSYLQIIAVQPRIRGRKVADAMMDYLERKLIDAGINKLSLSTYSDNEYMTRFLNRWNFEEIYKETVLYKEEITGIKK